ncbi:MAG: dienelactone hydrolase [Acidobacteriota bacterium]|nr:dienelactone hydrolase [Acidobacteriota bacterium]
MFPLAVFAMLPLVAPCGAQPDSAIPFSVPGTDAPELAALGPYRVGVRTIDLVHPGQVDILNFNNDTGKAPLYDRPLKIEVWYPAVIPPGEQERTVYTSPMPGRTGVVPPGVPRSFQFSGKALRDAAPVMGEQFPLVIVSHGYPGSRTFLSYLTENLASKGYIVAAIDHTDSVFGDVRRFDSTLLNRASDQLFTMNALDQRSRRTNDFLHGLLAVSRVAIVGYSMGGYGALASAGAGYSANGSAAKLIPGAYFKDWLAGSAAFEGQARANLKAVVAIAPWGAQPPRNNWDASGLEGIRIPSLFIDGDQDDVSDYRQGVKPAFERTVNSERCLLVYENARHNVGGNPIPPGFPPSFILRESFAEPVWRKDRIDAINQHFITAFLDLYLKGDESRRAYLHPSIENSNDGAWPLKPGESAGSSFSQGSGTAGQKYWKGFQRRWAVGLEMHCYNAGQKAK